MGSDLFRLKPLCSPRTCPPAAHCLDSHVAFCAGAQGAGPSMAATLDPSAAGASIPSRIDTPEGITVLLVDGSILDEPVRRVPLRHPDYCTGPSAM